MLRLPASVAENQTSNFWILVMPPTDGSTFQIICFPLNLLVSFFPFSSYHLPAGASSRS